MEFENDNGNDGQKAADESAGRSVSDVLTEEEEIRIWKREGYDDLPRSLTVPAVGKHLGVSRSKAYSMVKGGHDPSAVSWLAVHGHPLRVVQVDARADDATGSGVGRS